MIGGDPDLEDGGDCEDTSWGEPGEEAFSYTGAGLFPSRLVLLLRQVEARTRADETLTALVRQAIIEATRYGSK